MFRLGRSLLASVVRRSPPPISLAEPICPSSATYYYYLANRLASSSQDATEDTVDQRKMRDLNRLPLAPNVSPVDHPIDEAVDKYGAACISPPRTPKMAQIIDGKKIAEDIRTELRTQIEQWVAEGHRAPQLTALLIGEDPASRTYVNNKMKAALEVGINSVTKNLSPTITEDELLALIEQLNADDGVDGILVQLPVPGHINERRICNSVSCFKDVDGFNEKNVGRLCLDMNTLIPCTPLGVQELIKRTGVETFGKNAVVVGRSKNVGMPISMLLHADGRNDTCAMDATVTICHRFTPPDELKAFCKLADIIVTAAGVPGLITADMVKPGACIIDVGLTRIIVPETGKAKLVGDVDFEGVSKVAGHITPVPGGVGPMTVTMLMKNTFVACKNLVHIKQQTEQ